MDVLNNNVYCCPKDADVVAMLSRCSASFDGSRARVV